jgi:nucleotide-binding universal stress UspA family protein
MFKNIIWASDGSDAAQRALSTALELAADSDAKLMVVHADERFGGRAGGVPALADEDEVQDRLEALVQELVESGVDASLRIMRGTNREPADLVADVARDTHADVIVVGTRGHGRIAGMILGSVAQRLLHVAPCPVLAVPAKAGVSVAAVER